MDGIGIGPEAAALVVSSSPAKHAPDDDGSGGRQRRRHHHHHHHHHHHRHAAAAAAPPPSPAPLDDIEDMVRGSTSRLLSVVRMCVCGSLRGGCVYVGGVRPAPAETATPIPFTPPPPPKKQVPLDEWGQPPGGLQQPINRPVGVVVPHRYKIGGRKRPRGGSSMAAAADTEDGGKAEGEGEGAVMVAAAGAAGAAGAAVEALPLPGAQRIWWV